MCKSSLPRGRWPATGIARGGPVNEHVAIMPSQSLLTMRLDDQLLPVVKATDESTVASLPVVPNTAHRMLFAITRRRAPKRQDQEPRRKLYQGA